MIVVPSALILFLAGCASHPATVIGALSGPEPSALSGKPIDFVVAFNYLGSVDDPTDTKLSGFAYDQRSAITQVSGVLAGFHQFDALRVVDSAEAATAPYVVDMKIHQFVAWIEILYALLPIPHSSNESVCVTATLTKASKTLSEYSECGFTKESGFWAWSVATGSSMRMLREYVTRKVVLQVLADVAAS
jgi:hypothetical protein